MWRGGRLLCGYALENVGSYGVLVSVSERMRGKRVREGSVENEEEGRITDLRIASVAMNRNLYHL